MIKMPGMNGPSDGAPNVPFSVELDLANLQ
jgi:hypothetical protein